MEPSAGKVGAGGAAGLAEGLGRTTRDQRELCGTIPEGKSGPKGQGYGLPKDFPLQPE